MKYSVDIADAVISIGKYLKENENLKQFCLDNFGKELTVIGGETLRRQIPGYDNAPWVAVTDFDKREGLDIEFCRYRSTIVVGVGAESNGEFIDVDGVHILDAYDVTCKLMNLIMRELSVYRDGQRPLSSIETDGPGPVEADGSVWVGFVHCVWRLYQSMGKDISTEF